MRLITTALLMNLQLLQMLGLVLVWLEMPLRLMKLLPVWLALQILQDLLSWLLFAPAML